MLKVNGARAVLVERGTEGAAERVGLIASNRRSKMNPKGIPAQSPGLRARELPWDRRAEGNTTPQGLRPHGRRSHQPSSRNPVGVFDTVRCFPRVARPSSVAGLWRVDRLATPGWRTQSLWD